MTQDKHKPADLDEHASDASPNESGASSKISPLPGEAGIPSITVAHRSPMAKKGLLAVALLAVSVIVAAAAGIHRISAKSPSADVADSKLTRDKPAAASSEPRKLEMPVSPTPTSEAASSPRIPALTPTTNELGEPIGVRRSGAGAPASGSKIALPEDAPVMLVAARPGSPMPGQAPGRSQAASGSDEDAMPVDGGGGSDDPTSSTSRTLRDYQRRLQGVLEGLSSTVTMANGQLGGTHRSVSPGTLPPGTAAPSGSSGGLFGGQLQGSSTPAVSAGMLGNRSLTLPKGTAFTCALKTKIVSASAGLVGCEVQRNIFSDDGRVLLIERGSHLDGEYRVTSLKPGSVRIPVLWTRIRTPFGVTADIESPGTGQLGESGIDGYVDKRWTERIGAALMLSLIDDSVKLIVQNQSNERQGDTIVLPSTTANTSKLAEKVLDSTISIPPLIYQNQGGIVGIYVARDIDFSTVYELLPAPAAQPHARPSAQPREATP